VFFFWSGEFREVFNKRFPVSTNRNPGVYFEPFPQGRINC
jgi:hypothetical protein